jgi:pimeloyl-ACP methyl ester carboxylesterase
MPSSVATIDAVRATASNAISSELVKTLRGQVECAVWGEGPAVLSLHGAMGGYDQGVLLARTVAAPRFRFVAISRPGYLGTPLVLGRTPQEQADLCAEVLDELALPKVAVMAISGGGPAALQFALRHPARCNGLVMISACSGRLDVPVPFQWQIMKLLARIPGATSGMRRKLANDPEKAAMRSIPDAALRERTVNHPEAGPLMLALQLSILDNMARRIRGTDNDIRQTRVELAYPLERIEAPTLAVHGMADSVVPFIHAQWLVARVPGAELFAVEGGEHVTIFTHLAEVRARVTEFLDSLRA